MLPRQIKLVNHRHARPLVACDPCPCTLVAEDLHTSDYIGFTDKIRCQQIVSPLYGNLYIHNVVVITGYMIFYPLSIVSYLVSNSKLLE
jgi:hypothetical protein